MKRSKLVYIIMVTIMIVALTGCTLPGFSTPTPFTFPTPDKTMTALFEPTQAVPATSAADDTGTETAGDQETATPKVVPTNTPQAGETEEVPDTAVPTVVFPTETPISYVGPAVRSGPSVIATKRTSSITIDGSQAEWAEPWQYVIDYVVFGAANWTSEADCSGDVKAVWDEDYLYFVVKVKDDKYVQEGAEEKIYLGDSIEIVFDRYVSGDYYLQAMTADDYQIGISPGRYGIAGYVGSSKVSAVVITEPPMAYMWAPKASAGVKTEIKVGAAEGVGWYQVEFKIPWSLLGVSDPNAGDHYGFAISISDNDVEDSLAQQSMVSNVSTRFYNNPTSWGDLYLK